MRRNKPKKSRMAKVGWWPEGGIVDRADKAASLWLFKLELGKAEYLLSIPGVWFGVPIIAAGVLPLGLTAFELWVHPPTAGAVSSIQWTFGVLFPVTVAVAYKWFERSVRAPWLVLVWCRIAPP
jgi:hypothetical protein